MEEVLQAEDTPVRLKLGRIHPALPQEPEVDVQVEPQEVRVDVGPDHEGTEVPEQDGRIYDPGADERQDHGPGGAPRSPAIQLVVQTVAGLQGHALLHLSRHELLEGSLQDNPAGKQQETLGGGVQRDALWQAPDELLPELCVWGRWDSLLDNVEAVRVEDTNRDEESPERRADVAPEFIWPRLPDQVLHPCRLGRSLGRCRRRLGRGRLRRGAGDPGPLCLLRHADRRLAPATAHTHAQRAVSA
mmetsp:Transcript_60343/g.155507  ORF Transcript_60343/g.155507 Transcript_60343/m.155507 type:complete len:245 (-) Transcript_60343:2-736(-)